MKALIKDGVVQNLSDTEYPPFDDMIWVDCPDDCQPGWKYVDGEFIAPIQPTPTPEQQLELFNMSVQNYIDSVAIQRGYINGATCISYWISSNQSWVEDAKVFAPWRDQVWELAFVAIEPFESGTGELPDLNTFIASLPQIVWPS
jgi:hypothetical protein